VETRNNYGRQRRLGGVASAFPTEVSLMSTDGPQKTAVHEGDWIEVSGLPGRSPRRGQVLEVLGEPGHEHYRVRWDEQHESIFFPTEGVHVVHA
jgi:hypothetical protein